MSVRLTEEAGHLCLAVSDRGPGGAPAPPAGGVREQLGLANMRDRAQLLGGQFRLTSRPGEGTTVEARWPLAEPVNAVEAVRTT